MATRQAAGGARTLEIPPERLARWIDGFHARHPGTTDSPAATGILYTSTDGEEALIEPAFPPLAQPDTPGLVEHALRTRRIGVLLCRLGGHAAGIFEGRRLVASKVGHRQVHGRSSAGGWSQQRFARRREGQVAVAQAAAADAAARVFAEQLGSLEGLVLGGDRSMLTAVLADRRLAGCGPLVQARIIDVVDPRLDVLKGSIDAARSARVTLRRNAPTV